MVGSDVGDIGQDSARGRLLSDYSAASNLKLRRSQSGPPRQYDSSAPEKIFLKNLQQEARRRRRNHKWMGKRYNRLDKCLRGITAVCSGASATLAHSDLAHSGDFVNVIGGQHSIDLIAIACTMTAAFALAVNSRLRCKERSRIHNQSSDLWRGVDSLIKDYDRHGPRTFRQRDRHMYNIRNAYDAALKSSPTVPSWSFCTLCPCHPTGEGRDDASGGHGESERNASEPEDLEHTRGHFSQRDVDKLLERYAQACLVSKMCDELAEKYHALSSTIGSIAGALAIMALACQALSFSEAALSWCGVAGFIGNVGMLGLSFSESAGGFDDNSKLLHLCRTEFGKLAVEILQSVYTQPHIQPATLVNTLDMKVGDLFTFWETDANGLLQLFDVGQNCNRGDEEVKKIKKKALEDACDAGVYSHTLEVASDAGVYSHTSAGRMEDLSDVEEAGNSQQEEPKPNVTPLSKTANTVSTGATPLSQSPGMFSTPPRKSQQPSCAWSPARGMSGDLLGADPSMESKETKEKEGNAHGPHQEDV